MFWYVRNSRDETLQQRWGLPVSSAVRGPRSPDPGYAFPCMVLIAFSTMAHQKQVLPVKLRSSGREAPSPLSGHLGERDRIW